MQLLSIQAFGILYTVILFLLCLFIVHAVRLAVIGYKSVKNKPAEKKPAAAQEQQGEPVYYIVERKKKRPKSEYSDPKRIQFK